ncbi:MAG: PEP-CTERM sorting domain-containing protein [Verrucomicrobiia bacterium]
MKLHATAWLVVISLVILQNAPAQDFQDLDFESANLTPPTGQRGYGGSVSISDALPGWTGYLGANQVTTVLQDNYTLGNPSIDILGPNWSYGDIIEGQYTVVLQPGDGDSGYVGASISQSGLVPENALSLQFKAQTFSSFSVSLGGQDLSLIPLGTGANYTLYGADISRFAGKVETLTITALAAPNTVDYFDSIVFSPSSVPEPSVLGLFALSGLFFCLRRPK